MLLLGGKMTPQGISGSMILRIKIPTAIPPFSGSRNSMALFRILSDVSGSRKSKMAANKLVIRISRFLDKTATPFQRQTPIFGVQQLNGAIENTVRCNRKSVFKDGGRQTGSTYISATRQDSNSVSGNR